jgi:hypothetical protein
MLERMMERGLAVPGTFRLLDFLRRDQPSTDPREVDSIHELTSAQAKHPIEMECGRQADSWKHGVTSLFEP